MRFFLGNLKNVSYHIHENERDVIDVSKIKSSYPCISSTNNKTKTVDRSLLTDVQKTIVNCTLLIVNC